MSEFSPKEMTQYLMYQIYEISLSYYVRVPEWDQHNVREMLHIANT